MINATVSYNIYEVYLCQSIQCKRVSGKDNAEPRKASLKKGIGLFNAHKLIAVYRKIPMKACFAHMYVLLSGMSQMMDRRKDSSR